MKGCMKFKKTRDRFGDNGEAEMDDVKCARPCSHLEDSGYCARCIHRTMIHINDNHEYRRLQIEKQMAEDGFS